MNRCHVNMETILMVLKLEEQDEISKIEYSTNLNQIEMLYEGATYKVHSFKNKEFTRSIFNQMGQSKVEIVLNEIRESNKKIMELISKKTNEVVEKVNKYTDEKLNDM